MLNRRHLRIKVLQGLYSYFQSRREDIPQGEKELFHSIERIKDLYLYLLVFLTQIRDHAEHLIEERKQKKLPTPEDLDPNTKFIDNKLLKKLQNAFDLQREVQRRKLEGGFAQELVPQIFKEIENSEEYHDYMNSGKDGVKEDREFIAKAFKEYVANSEALQYKLEEISIYWMDDLDLVSSHVLKTIKSVDKPEGNLGVLPLFKDDEDKEFTKTLFRKTILHHEDNRELIARKAKNWEMERIAQMDMIIMEMAITEAMEFEQVPLKVTLNEFIEISKFYSTPKSDRFINGILDKSFAELKNAGKIRKVGRGLIE